MSGKKNRRSRKTQVKHASLAAFLRSRRKWLRRAAVASALLVVAIAVWFLADPLAGPPKAIDESGREVEAGVLDRPGASARVGNAAPTFLLPDYEKRAVSLADFQGKVVFVNFWASWCTFCEKEMPDIMRIAERFPDDVVVLAVNRGESSGTAERWSRGHDFPDLPNVFWLLDSREDVTREYRVDGMPQSFVIDRDGYVAQELRRVLDYDQMLAAVQETLITVSPQPLSP